MPYNQAPAVLSAMSPVRRVALVTISAGTPMDRGTALAADTSREAMQSRWWQYPDWVTSNRRVRGIIYDPLLMTVALTTTRRP